MKHVVMFSGGAGSWAAAKRVAAEYGTADLILLFADTRVEDRDTYRFLHEAASEVGGELVIVCDGRTPFEVFNSERFLGNSRLAACSHVLKQRPCRAWVERHCQRDGATVYVGIDWTEGHRLPAVERGWAPWPVVAPLSSPPYLDKHALLAAVRAAGLRPPADYAIGLPHANCGAQGCVRGGQAYWMRLLQSRPEVYRRTEQSEQDLRRRLGADVAILTDRTGGQRRPLTLRELRERAEVGDRFDQLDFGACGCFTDRADDARGHGPDPGP
jgi:hypothetical protein